MVEGRPVDVVGCDQSAVMTIGQRNLDNQGTHNLSVGPDGQEESFDGLLEVISGSRKC